MNKGEQISLFKKLFWKLHGIEYGENFKLGKNVKIIASKKYSVHIGNNVELAPEVEVWTRNNITKKWSHEVIFGSVVIGSNVFVGYNSRIMPNVTIGNNVIIIGTSVVFDDIPDNSVVGGTPARVFNRVENFDRSKELYQNSAVYDFS